MLAHVVEESLDKTTMITITIQQCCYVFGPPGSGFGSISTRYGSGYGSGSGSGSFYDQAKIVRKTLIPTVMYFFMTFYL